MKPVIFTNVFSPLSETFIYTLVNGLRAVEPQTRVATLRRIDALERPFPNIDVFPYRKTQLILERAIPPLSRRLNLLGVRSFHTAFVEYLKATEPDIIHAQFAPNACAIAASCRDAKVPLVVSFRGFDASASLRSGYWRREFKRMLRIASAAIVVSDEMRDRIAPLAPNELPIETVHAGKEPADYPFTPKRIRGMNLISIGRLIEKKGHDDAIRVTAEVRKLGLDAKLTIVGSGPMRQRLEKIAKHLRVDKHVHLHGPLSHEMTKELMSRADYLILASRTARSGDMEGVPNVLKEAQLLGIPFVATDHGGARYSVPRILRQELAPEGDWKALTAQLMFLHGLPNDIISSRLRSSRFHIEKNFSLDLETQKHVDIYHRVMTSHSNN